MLILIGAFGRLKQPEYTGENRCMPCTVANVIIALALAAGISLLWPPGGVVAMSLFAIAIYFRGYLVPGTPELTQRYFPGWLLLVFGKDSLEGVTADKHNTRSVAPDGDTADPAETEQLLWSASVVEECDDEDDLCLTEEFREVWWRRIRRFRDDEERAAAQLAAVVDVDPSGLSFVDEGDIFGVSYDGDILARWASDAAFYADLAAEPTLSEYIPDWEELGGRQRTALLAGMRLFLEECPACDADLDQVEDVRKSCCSDDMVSVSVVCEECGAALFSGSYT